MWRHKGNAAMKTLRVLARADVLVMDTVFAGQTGKRRYVGRKAVGAWKVEDLPQGEPSHVAWNQFLEPGEKPMQHFAFPKTGVVETVPRELWPADFATAQECKVDFDSTFGGDYPAS
jgi:hypothetical protein